MSKITRRGSVAFFLGLAVTKVFGLFRGSLDATPAIASADDGLLPRVAALEILLPPVGTVLAYAGTWPPTTLDHTEAKEPTGWMLCDGRAMKSQTYKSLYQRIGTMHGNGKVDFSNSKGPAFDFNLPDYRGYFLRGEGTADGLERVEIDGRHAPHKGRAGGNERGVGSVQSFATALPKKPFSVKGGGHRHSLTLQPVHGKDPGNRFGWGGTNVDTPNVPPWSPPDKAWGGGEHEHIVSDGDLETRPHNCAVHFIIRVS